MEAVDVVAHNADSRGIPLPVPWRTASLCLALDEIAGRSAHAERSSAYPGLTCEILGMPKAFADTSNGDSERAPGSVVILQAQAGERLAHLLCAHVEGNRWLCHRGSFLGGVFDVDNPFDAADLVEKDVVLDAWDAEGKPTHRIFRQPKLSPQAMRKAVQDHGDAWNGVVAVATPRNVPQLNGMVRIQPSAIPRVLARVRTW